MAAGILHQEQNRQWFLTLEKEDYFNKKKIEEKEKKK